MKAVWKGKVIAEAPKEDLIYIEQNWYFPPASVKKEFFRESATHTPAHGKVYASIFDVGNDAEDWSKDSAWSYPKPLPTAIEKSQKDFSNYVAFWRDVTVSE